MSEMTCEELWQKCLNVIKDNVSPQNFRTWFEPIVPINVKNKTLTIQVPTAFFFEYLEENYITLIKKTIKRFLGKDGKLDYNIIVEGGQANPYITNIPSNMQSTVKNSPISIPIAGNNHSIRNPFIIPGLQKININPQLNPSYTFTAFVEGECNRLARSAGYAVSQNRGGTSFNPLLIYGGGGLGKTHLANAIGLETKKNISR